MGDGELELRPGDVDPLRHRFGGPAAARRSDDGSCLSAVARHQRGRKFAQEALGSNVIGANECQIAGSARSGRQTPRCQSPVQHVLGHESVLGELAAHHAEHSGVVLQHGVVA